MTHEMRLHDEPFNLLKNGTKTIELRLYDEKRREIHEGDNIEFTNRVTNEKIMTTVIKLHIYRSFKELYGHFDKVSLGYKENEEAAPEDNRPWKIFYVTPLPSHFLCRPLPPASRYIPIKPF